MEKPTTPPPIGNADRSGGLLATSILALSSVLIFVALRVYDSNMACQMGRMGRLMHRICRRKTSVSRAVLGEAKKRFSLAISSAWA